VADNVISKLKTYLAHTHDFDISMYPEKIPQVQRQGNNYDCGFHVLLYIQGFQEMDRYNIKKEVVFKFGKKLSVEVSHHRLNKIIPAILPISEFTADVEENEEDNEGFIPSNY